MLYDIYQAALAHPKLRGIPQYFGDVTLHQVGDVPRIHWVPTQDRYDGPIVGDWLVPLLGAAPAQIAGADANGGINYSLRTARACTIAHQNLGASKPLQVFTEPGPVVLPGGAVDPDGLHVLVQLRADAQAYTLSTAAEVAAAVAADAAAGPLLSGIPTGTGLGLAGITPRKKIRAIRTRWAGCELQMLAADWRPCEELINRVHLVLQDLAMGSLHRLAGEWAHKDNLTANAGYVQKLEWAVPIFDVLPAGTFQRVLVAWPAV